MNIRDEKLTVLTCKKCGKQWHPMFSDNGRGLPCPACGETMKPRLQRIVVQDPRNKRPI